MAGMVHLGYESNGFLGRDFSGEYLTYQKFKVFDVWVVRVTTVEGEVLDEFRVRAPEPTMEELRQVVQGYARALGAMSYV